MKRSGGFAVVETLISALVIAIIVLGGYYVVKHNQQKNTPVTMASGSTNQKTQSSADKSVFKIPEFGIKLVNVPLSIQDMYYNYYPANTESNFTEAQFTTTSLTLKDSNCSIGLLDKYPGKYNASNYQGSATFVKQFKGFWIAEVDAGVPCKGDQAVLNLQNSQITAFKEYVTNPKNLQLLQ